jgi:hypothetical protein
MAAGHLQQIVPGVLTELSVTSWLILRALTRRAVDLGAGERRD